MRSLRPLTPRTPEQCVPLEGYHHRGGPHARCFPEDARQYFDSVLGFTDRETLRDVLQDCSQYRPVGRQIAAGQQPRALPGVRECWQFIEPILKKAPFVKIIPMLGSLGCPYTCSFCIDAAVPYQPLDFDGLQEDLRFLVTKFERPMVGWHEPNFGVRFNDYLDMIERVVPPGRIDFIAESSLSLSDVGAFFSAFDVQSRPDSSSP